MSDELSEEFSGIRSAVLNNMKEGAYHQRSGRRILQLITVSWFGATDCLELCEARANGQMQVTHLQWDAERDRAAFCSPVERMKHSRPFLPSVSARSILVSDSVFRNVLREITSVHLALTVPKHHSGVDGTSYELTLGDSFCSIRLDWWSKLPSDWIALEQPLEELRRISESLAWDSGDGAQNALSC